MLLIFLVYTRKPRYRVINPEVKRISGFKHTKVYFKIQTITDSNQFTVLENTITDRMYIDQHTWFSEFFTFLYSAVRKTKTCIKKAAQLQAAYRA